MPLVLPSDTHQASRTTGRAPLLWSAVLVSALLPLGRAPVEQANALLLLGLGLTIALALLARLTQEASGHPFPPHASTAWHGRVGRAIPLLLVLPVLPQGYTLIQTLGHGLGWYG